MDKTLKPRKEMDPVPEKCTDVNEQQDGEAMEESKADTGIASAKPENAEEELVEELPPDSVARSIICTECDFVAKSERSLKIHFVKKHRRNSEEIDADTSDVGRAELPLKKHSQTEADQDEPERILKKSDMTSNVPTHQEDVSAQERRISKRTPKPKVFHSCNYCGQEFRDKAPLDVHVQRYHSKDTQFTFDADEDMEEDEEETEDSASTSLVVPTKVASKRPHSSSQLKCENCEVVVSSHALLENHVQVHHTDIDWFRCKLCNFFTATTGWMKRHLSSENHKTQLNKDPAPKPLAFEKCVERVSRSSAGEGVLTGASVDLEHVKPFSDKDIDSEEALNAGLAEKDDLENEPPKKKRGRPKLDSTNTCEHCGLVVSTAANLSVHVRRKHSKQYAYTCTLCSYNCVTKGDMDRHCITRKHVKRVERGSKINPASRCTIMSVPETTASPVHEADVVISTVKDEQKSESSDSKEQSGVEQTLPDTNQQKFEYENVHPCNQCEFVAQTMGSLDLHVKRKHTNEFEYVCLACSYYAVTSRDMVRHANTEKHKQKREAYMDTQESESSRAKSLPAKPDKLKSDSLEKEAKSCADANQTEDGQHISKTSDLTETKHEGCMADEAHDENTMEIITVTVGGELDSQDQTPEPKNSEPTQDPSDEQPLNEQDEKEEEGHTDVVAVKVSAESMRADRPMSRAPPFDACIVSAKSISEQAEETPKGVNLEAKTTVDLSAESTGTSSFGHNYPHVKKLNPKETEGRGEATSSSTRIRCEDCGFMADGINGLNVHISMKHASKEKHFHCLVCGKSFYTENNLHQHLSSAAHLRIEQNCVEELPDGGANFKCMKCTARLNSEQDLFVHIKEKHVELLREVNKYVLEDTELINREREENQGSVCKYCGKVCKSSNSMAFLAHIRTHTGSKPFMCKICDFASAQLGDARNHVKRHLGMREYKCDICGWAFVMKKHLSTHMLGKHGIGQPKERKFECELCERSFSEKWALNNHMKLHSGEKPYKCPWPSCHYSFLNQSAMKDHHRTHTGEKSYLCDLCGFAGGTKHALTKHRRQHTGERPFKCTLCKFASTTQSHLSRHKRVHTGEKPYRCPWCEYRSNCAENIRKHILHTGKHEGVKMYNCPKCVFATNSPVEFRNHLKDSHPDIENPDLAYLHAGIVSKAFDCRLRGQGATFVETEALTSPPHPPTSGHEGSIQQVIIIQGYGDGEVGQTLEESAAATLQTLAMAGQVAEVLHITEDGQVITSSSEVPPAGAHLADTSTQYVVLDSEEAQEKLKSLTGGTVAGQSHPPSESSTALDALLNAVSEIGHQEEVQEEEEVIPEMVTPEVEVTTQRESQPRSKKAKEAAVPESNQEDIQEVLKLAASQMMKDGLTQVIVNDKGTHYIVTELQLEEGVYREAVEVDGGEQQVEQQETEEMVVYLQG